MDKINSGGFNPLSLSRAERTERVEQALDQQKVNVGQLNAEQLAAHRDYGLKLTDGISAARFQQPANGVAPADFEALAARLSG